MPVCDVCLNLDWNLYPNTLSQSEDNTAANKLRIINSRSIALSANRGCELCSILHQGIVAFRQYIVSLLPPWKLWDLSGPCTVHIELRLGRSLQLFLSNFGHEREEESGAGSLTRPLRHESTPGREKYEIAIEYFACADRPAPPCAAFGPGRQVPENLDKRMSIQVIQDWLSYCTDQHTCISKELPKLPARVLDIAPLTVGKDVVLVETSAESGRYMTLSHCWGSSKAIETRKKTLSMMKHELSIRYLWIDSVCIIQDDNADWERESSMMAEIYANTYLNIAATSSRASDDGCFKPRWMEAMVADQVWSFPVKDVKIEGIDDGRPFEIFARLEMWGAHQDFLTSNTASDIHIRSPLLARAWVFQELYLSPRTVHFHASELIWECKACVQCECTELEHEIHEENILSRQQPQETLFLADSNERFYFWLSIINEYCMLNLTYESDRLPALAGLASRFEDQTTGKYFGGMWEKDLVRMLLWSLKCSTATCTRGRLSTTPSWSWASIVAYANPHMRGDNSPNYLLAQDSSCTSFKQNTNAKVLKVECTVPGINPFGQVSMGTIFISGTIVHSTLVRRRLLTHIGENIVSDTFYDSKITNIYSVEDVHTAPEILVRTDLIFEQEEDDLIIITRQSFIPDIWFGEEILDGDSVLCLLLGTSEIGWEAGAKTVALCLVLKHSTNRKGAFERIGVMMCDPESGIFRAREDCVIELV